MHNWHIYKAIRILKKGEIIAYPTESVYGLGCDPFNSQAIFKLLSLKQRSIKKGFILIAADIKQLQPFLKLTPEIIQKITSPQPITWLVPCQDNIPYYLKGQYQTLAVRITQHPLAQALCQYYKQAIISTSANIANRPPAKTPLQVRHYFAKKIAHIIPGELGGLEKPTQIYNVIDNKLIRF